MADQRPTNFVVQTTEAARLLFDPKSHPMLVPFFGEPTSVTNAAQTARVKPSTLLAAVGRFVRAGILVTASDQIVHGRRLHRYQTPAPNFIIPIDLAENFMLAPERHWQQAYMESFTHQVLEYHYKVEPIGAKVSQTESQDIAITGAIGHDWHDYDPTMHGPNLFFDWRALYLSETDASSLRAELRALTMKYEARTIRDGSPHVFGVHLVPAHPAKRFARRL